MVLLLSLLYALFLVVSCCCFCTFQFHFLCCVVFFFLFTKIVEWFAKKAIAYISNWAVSWKMNHSHPKKELDNSTDTMCFRKTGTKSSVRACYAPPHFLVNDMDSTNEWIHLKFDIFRQKICSIAWRARLGNMVAFSFQNEIRIRLCKCCHNQISMQFIWICVEKCAPFLGQWFARNLLACINNQHVQLGQYPRSVFAKLWNWRNMRPKRNKNVFYSILRHTATDHDVTFHPKCVRIETKQIWWPYLFLFGFALVLHNTFSNKMRKNIPIKTRLLWKACWLFFFHSNNVAHTWKVCRFCNGQDKNHCNIYVKSIWRRVNNACQCIDYSKCYC